MKYINTTYICDCCKREMGRLNYTFGHVVYVRPFWVDYGRGLSKYKYHLCEQCYNNIKKLIRERSLKEKNG